MFRAQKFYIYKYFFLGVKVVSDVCAGIPTFYFKDYVALTPILLLHEFIKRSMRAEGYIKNLVENVICM